MKYKSFRFEWEEVDENNNPITWGWDVVLSQNYKSAKKWIFENVQKTYCHKPNKAIINYIAEIKYERPEEEL